MQYLRPFLPGPSGKTWPKCASHTSHFTYVLTIKWDLSSKDLIDALL